MPPLFLFSFIIYCGVQAVLLGEIGTGISEQIEMHLFPKREEN